MAAGFSALIVGILFGFGLTISGMTQPHKVIGFLDFTGAWDPTLIFVMIGGIAVHALSYRLLASRPSPLLGERFHMPTAKDIDGKLIIGSALFGTGWGLAGYCPGPALVSLSTLQPEIFLFVGAMALGMAFQSATQKALERRQKNDSSNHSDSSSPSRLKFEETRS